jgi:hypothetical protein
MCRWDSFELYVWYGVMWQVSVLEGKLEETNKTLKNAK